jgi:hypothetical protein
MGCNDACSLDFRCPWARRHKGHKEHGIWDPFCWNRDDKEGGHVASIILAGSVGKCQHESRGEYNTASDEYIQALFLC